MKLLNISMFIIPIFVAGGFYVITKILPKKEGLINYEEF